MRTRRAVITSIAAALVVGCASILGIEYGQPYPDGGIDGAGFDAADDGFMDVRLEAAPIPDVNVEANSATCDDFTRVLLDGGVFLSPTGSDNNPCTPASPCRSLSFPILQKAVSAKAPIYLLAGDYPYALDLQPFAGSVTLVVEGGWTLDGGAWNPACDFNLASIHGAKPIASGVTGAYVNQGSTLTLRLVSVGTDPGAGTSYGLFGNQPAAITLEGVAVRAGSSASNAADGVVGMGAGMNNCVVGNGAMGAAGMPGTAGDRVYNPLGYAPLTALGGLQGGVGGGGTMGNAGVPGMCPGCDAGWMMDPEGGAMTMWCTDTTITAQGTPGQPGCGGGGGNAGGGGASAHGSIALFVTGSGTLVLKSGTKLTTSAGAKGGNGALGASGALGSDGLPGMPAYGTGCSGKFCIGGMIPCADGGAGGMAGGQGGSGGQGGGGLGGPSVTIVRQTTVKSTVYDASVLGFQAGGEGGLPNGGLGDQQPEITF